MFKPSRCSFLRRAVRPLGSRLFGSTFFPLILAFAIVLAQAAPTNAQILPDYFGTATCAPGSDGFPKVGDNVSCAYSFPTSDGTVTLNGEADFLKTQSVHAFSLTSNTLYGGDASSILTYYFAAIGPPNEGFSTLDIVSSGVAYGVANAEMDSNGTPLRFACSGPDCLVQSPGWDDRAIPIVFSAGNGQVITLSLFVSAAAGSSASELFPPTASAASIDPYITIDPSTPNADQWSIVFSPGIINVAPAAAPEPATLALLGVGLAGLGFSRRKQ